MDTAHHMFIVHFANLSLHTENVKKIVRVGLKIYMVKSTLIYVFVYLIGFKTPAIMRPNGHSTNGRFWDV